MAKRRRWPASTKRAGSADSRPQNQHHSLDKRLDQAARVIEVERAQIGHEIHDALLPLIFAASASVGAMIDQAAESDVDGSADHSRQHERLRQVADWLDQAMQTGRRLLIEVYPPELSEANWTHVAADAVERLLGPSSSAVTWDVDPDVNAIDPHLALTAYRVVVEAIRNAVRHGRANRVVVSAHRTDAVSVGASSEDPRWLVEVSDDGVGFDPQLVPDDRFGIRSMTGRTQLVGGELSIESQPGGPTRVRVQLPIQRIS